MLLLKTAENGLALVHLKCYRGGDGGDAQNDHGGTQEVSTQDLVRYRNASKPEKTRLLTEAEAVTGMHRKSVLRILNGQNARSKEAQEIWLRIIGLDGGTSGQL